MSETTCTNCPAGGFILTDPGQRVELYWNTSIYTVLWPITSMDIYDSAATLSADDTYTGRTMKGYNAGEAVAQWDCVYWDQTATEYMISDNTGDNAATTPDSLKECQFVATTTGSNGAELVVLKEGLIRNDAWNWTIGLPIYLSTAGDYTQTPPTSASAFLQEAGIAISADVMHFKPKPVDFTRRRIATDADGGTLTCLEVQNTTWEVTGASTIVGPALSECPVQDFSITSGVAGAVVYDPNAADDTRIDGVAKGDGVAWTSGSALGDTITVQTYDTDTLIGLSNGWTAP